MIIYVDIDNTICHTENSDCKYTRIETEKKPSYDLFICDKTKRIEEI